MIPSYTADHIDETQLTLWYSLDLVLQHGLAAKACLQINTKHGSEQGFEKICGSKAMPV